MKAVQKIREFCLRGRGQVFSPICKTSPEMCKVDGCLITICVFQRPADVCVLLMREISCPFWWACTENSSAPFSNYLFVNFIFPLARKESETIVHSLFRCVYRCSFFRPCFRMKGEPAGIEDYRVRICCSCMPGTSDVRLKGAKKIRFMQGDLTYVVCDRRTGAGVCAVHLHLHGTPPCIR